MRGIRDENGMTPIVAPNQTQLMSPSTSGDQSNIIPPPGNYLPGYFDHGMGPPGGHFDPKVHPQTASTATITPVTPGTQWQQPHHTGHQPPVTPLPQPVHEMPSDPASIAELKG